MQTLMSFFSSKRNFLPNEHHVIEHATWHYCPFPVQWETEQWYSACGERAKCPTKSDAIRKKNTTLLEAQKLLDNQTLLWKD